MRMPFHLISLFAAVLTAHGVSAEIVAAEYFIDVDPGQGNGTRVELASPGSSPAMTVEVPASEYAKLSLGVHHLGIRLQDQEGEWSEAFSRTFSKDASPVSRPSASIVAAEYFIDTDPGLGLGIPVVVGSVEDPISLEIGVSPAEFTALSTGMRRLAVRLLDSDGNWSEAFARTFSKDPSDTPLPERYLERIDYQWHDATGPVGGVFSTSAPAGTAVHTWLPELPMAQGAEGDVFRLVITPYDTQGGRGDSITQNVKLAPPPVLAEVLAEAFPGARPEDLLPSGNPLGDTLNNLQKYFLGLEPTRRTGGGGLSIVAPNPSGAGGAVPRSSRPFMESQAPVALLYTRNRYARNVTGTVEASISLTENSWAPVEAVEEVTPLDPYTDQVILRPIPPPDGGGRHFYRLKVKEEPQ